MNTEETLASSGGLTRQTPLPYRLAERAEPATDIEAIGSHLTQPESAVTPWRVDHRVSAGGTDASGSLVSPAGFHEFGTALAETHMASIRSDGEVIASQPALWLLDRLRREGEIQVGDLAEEVEAVVDLARAGLLFAAAGRVFPTVDGLRLLEDLRQRFPG